MEFAKVGDRDDGDKMTLRTARATARDYRVALKRHGTDPRINGQPGLACHTHLDKALASSREGVIEVEPMGNMPVIKDLIVDMDAVHWKKVQRVTPWLVNKELKPIWWGKLSANRTRERIENSWTRPRSKAANRREPSRMARQPQIRAAERPQVERQDQEGPRLLPYANAPAR
jgi:hypothetical protein